jgi:formimidoylglutamate deiminase
MTLYQETDSLIAWLPDLIFAGGRFQSGLALVCDSSGTIVKLAPPDELRNERRINLTNRAMLPGMINSHSHAFQRVLRGRTEYRSRATEAGSDSFWTWREMMYSTATRLTPEDIYDASRMAFLEMALNGITGVGEFHYLQHQPGGTPYDDPNLLAKEVVRAAREVGVRIALLSVAYARSGFQTEQNPSQARFIETDPDRYLRNLQKLIDDLTRGSSPTVRKGVTRIDDAVTDARAPSPPPSAWVGVAPHSVRAVPLDYLKEVIGHANQTGLKIHMHVAEQPAEVSACVEEYGRTPVALLQTEGMLSGLFTAVHAIHVTAKAIAAFARTGAMVCACPTTERNLGDGVVPAHEYFKHNVTICLGTDSHAQIDLLEDARELEYHLRLQRLERAVLDRGGGPTVAEGIDLGASSLAAVLFECATINGSRSIGAPTSAFEPGKAADFFTVALDDPSIAGFGSDDLLASIVFSLARTAVREVIVSGKPIVSEGQHLEQEEIVERFIDLQKRLWN